MRYAQLTLMFHHQPTRTVSDNSILTRQTLVEPDQPMISGLTEVNLRGGRQGKFVWTVDGADYTKQYLPPTISGLEASPELMIAQMDYVGVDRAVLQTGHIYGKLNRYLSDAVRKYPGRFWGLAMVDEWRADHSSQFRVVDRAVNELGLHALWFQSSNISIHGRKEKLDDSTFDEFWEYVRKLGIPVFWFVTSAKPGMSSYLAELRSFDRWLDMHPDIPVVLTHGLLLSRFIDKGSVSIPSEVWKLLDHPNVLVELLFPIFQGSDWEYPYREAQPIVREYYERLGAGRLVWGSDMPNVERHCTYLQSLDYLRRHCGFISVSDMSKICGGNIADLFGGAR